MRRAQKDRWRAEEGFGLTYLPFVSRAVVDAIREFPEVNATLGETELIVHNYVNLGIAVDLDYKGLIVPVIHDADGKRLRAHRPRGQRPGRSGPAQEARRRRDLAGARSPSPTRGRSARR